MTIATYSDLTTAIADWLARGDLTARIPDFIAFAESKLNRTLRVRQMDQRSTTTIDTTSTDPQFISLPDDFQVMRSITLSSVDWRPRLDYMANASLDDERTRRGNGTGMPKFFTIIGDEIELCPSPDADYTLEMIYRKYIPALSVSNQTNWLLDLAPDLYVYSTLLQAAPYLKDDARIPAWMAANDLIVSELNQMSVDATYSAGPLTIRAVGNTP